MSQTTTIFSVQFRLPADFSAVSANINLPPPSWKFSAQEVQILEQLVKPFGGVWGKSFFYYNGEYTPSGENMSLFFSQEQMLAGEEPFYNLLKRPISASGSIYSLTLPKGMVLETTDPEGMITRLSQLLGRQFPALKKSSPAARL